VRTGPVAELEKAGPAGRLVRAATNARKFQKLSGDSWSSMVREGLAMRKSEGLSWSQVVMAANAPMLYRTALVDGNAEDGVMATGQVVGMIEDLPTCEELVSRIVREAGEALHRLGA
jgi:NAD(P)H-dependent flavin oxidoreductase YrpB (nitropropane dioxygenase family)